MRDDLSHQGVKLLEGARGRQRGDIEAMANLLVGLGDFAVANSGRFRALDLNPIIVKPSGEGVIAVDIAIEPNRNDASRPPTPPNSTLQERKDKG